MSKAPGLITKSLAAIAACLLVAPNASRAQSYPIDCAILLCLSGGWPASAPCARARAEFVRRITPWPVEPPLQIWRCPMGARFDTAPDLDLPARISDASFDGGASPERQSLRRPHTWPVQAQADIDISGPAFNFVRSIRVFHVHYASQRMAGPENDESCRRRASVRLGSYGLQGAFRWSRSTLTKLPASHTGLERWGEHCPRVSHRSVFVEWQDYSGNYGYEQVNY